MKTHELITLAEYISKIMSFYPNKTVDYALDDILNLLGNRENDKQALSSKKKHYIKDSYLNTDVSKKIINENNDELKKIHIDDLQGKTSVEIERMLLDESIFPTIESLKKLAAEVGIKSSSRQNRNILVMNILKTLERRKIDKTIIDKDK